MPTRILLVEDNPGDAIIFREKLNASDLDYELTHTKRLSEGLETLGSATYDILLVDLSLPDAQGLEAVTKVREAAPDRPLIVLTGLDDARAAAEAKKLGAVDYLVKWYVDSVSLARYIRYAIAQYQMYETGASDEAGFRPTSAEITPRPGRSGMSGTVVEGKIVERPAPVTERAEPEAGTAVAEPGTQTDDALRDALTAVDTAVLIVTEGREIVFASDAARAWVREDTYPWPVEEGRRRIPRKGRPLEQRASRTTWEGRAALLVTLALAPDETPKPAPEPAPQTATQAAPSPAEATLRRSTEAALAFVERAEQRSAWMADVLRSALDLHRTTHGDVTAQPTDLDALELAQQVVREHRSLAMSLGLPLRVTSPRKKVMAYGDRNLVNALLNRLIVDAVQSAGPEGVEVRADVDRSVSTLEVEWAESSRAADPAVEACAGLGRDLVERMVEAVGGESEHERRAGGHHLVTVRLPGRAEA
ncbi:MAG: response regulator [Rhodothermales bacterium]